MSANTTDDIDRPIIHLRNKGLLSLSKIADLILSGDNDCIDSLLETIRATMAAKHMVLHVQVVISLAGRCTTIRSLIHQERFPRSKEILQAFEELDDYARTGIIPRLN